MPKIDEDVKTNEAIEEDVDQERLRQEPLSLPNGFKWDTINIDDPLVVSGMTDMYFSLT